MNISVQDRVLAAVPHGLALIPMPPFNILAVFVYRMIVGTDSPLIERHTRENLNFQISYQLYIVACFLIIAGVGSLSSIFDGTAFDLPPILALIGIGGSFLVFGVLMLIGILITVLLVAALIKALMGQPYKFPLTIRFFK